LQRRAQPHRGDDQPSLREPGQIIQTLTMVDIATGWTECLPLVTRDGSLER
jgi:hypothetical protein